ncbi:MULTISPECIES: hypothetical protein [unclassified Acinetobacter]|uniref:hypothetical protein n=1 Tax=unclassified Acinetobacter TaxID=196816 RepID=UPI002449B85E|nr:MULTISPECIES: hypothetical protein [unclassified Acinetobacter]MDH0031334.1 hypothetical protein [Acinetobacter sp. GD04021]MDH0887181.1 hypothetical protein [Acinetobacter sp. GD03873]MDH1083530.1 hypothetical protein [Acinetobacter sp. GD03983]MDH2190497.1 hypothetical protein [Acinetobacter sp. GD03645]MDH2204057.1 hypothetical protein [Acinetobacter sp. GD03647]
MTPLPLKIYYTLKEAAKFLNEHLKRSDIDESYFFQLGIRGDIRLGVFAKPNNLGEDDTGVFYPNTFGLEFDESNQLDVLEIIHSTVLTLNEAGAILILNSGSVKDIYFNLVVKINNTYFDNVYSIDTQEFCVIGEWEKAFQCCSFFDKLRVLEFFDLSHYSHKHNAIHQSYSRGQDFISFPEIEEDDDWKIAYWFNDSFNWENMDDFQSEREITKNDCFVLGEDIELLLNGKKREPVERHPRKRSNQILHLEHNLKLHPKRENSINKIILALSSKAGLDLNNHITAYEKLKSFCEINGIDLPNKDTCGNLFKAANQFKNSK